MNQNELAPKAQSFEIKKDTTPPLNEVVGNLLSNAEIQALPEGEQGKVIVDRFIGSLVRHGGIESSNSEVGVMAPHDILAKIDTIGLPGSNGIHTERELTRTDGLRDSVKLLNSDPRTAALFGSMSQQLAIGRYEGGEVYYALTTPAQIDGYIESGGEKNKDRNAQPYTDPTEWIGVIASDVGGVIAGAEWRDDRDIADGVRNQSSVTPDWYKGSKDLYDARMKAKFAGIDIKLLKDSAEYIKSRDEVTKRELGARALSLATGGAAQRYDSSRKQWFENHLRSYSR